MDYAATMGVLERLSDLRHDAEGFFEIDASAIRRVQNIGKRATLQPFHDHEIQIVVSIEVDETHDVRMRQAAALGRFLLERP